MTEQEGAALLACEPPCPVAAGRMGLLCTCGNAPKRLHAIFDRLDAERDGQTAPRATVPSEAFDLTHPDHEEWVGANNDRCLAPDCALHHEQAAPSSAEGGDTRS